VPHPPEKSPLQAPPKSAVAEILTIAGPTVATMSSYTIMTFVDKWLVSRLDADPIYVGAQGNGGLASWCPSRCALASRR
jgi:Na+-driven multidrug efflux pump